MSKPRKRDLAKKAVRLHYALEGPDWDEAARQVGLQPESLHWFRSRRDWRELCAEVRDEMLADAPLVGLGRLLTTAQGDKSSSGVTAAKALVDIHKSEASRDELTGPEAEDGAGEEIDFQKLTEEQREFACRLLGRARSRRGSG